MKTHNADGMKRKFLFLAMALLIATESLAIIIIPLPNVAFPPTLSAIRDALEKSTDTKALATVGEDRVFGARFWTWGQAAGKMTQADADNLAMRRCEANLEKSKSQSVGGQLLYNFGSNRCELYKFANVTLNLPDPVAAPAPVAVQPPEPVAQPATSVTPSVPATPAAAAPAQVQSSAPQQNPLNASSDIVQKMRDLDTLYRQNLINKDEYERKKKQLLDAM